LYINQFTHLGPVHLLECLVHPPLVVYELPHPLVQLNAAISLRETS